MNERIVPGSTGRLTSRQREFLNSLIDIYDTRGQAVSYEDVASRMRVSKWTAYDILHDLYQRGFLRLEHAVTPGKGRSRILYSPEVSALPAKRGAVDHSKAELAASQWLRQQVVQYAKYSVPDSIRMAARSIMSEQNPFRIALRACVLMVLFESAFEPDIEQLVHFRRFLASALSAGTVLAVLSEFMFSLMRDEEWLLKNLRLPPESIARFAECEQSFQASMTRLSDREKQLMVSAIREEVIPRST